MKKTTEATKASQIKRDWHLINLKDKILGRESVAIAHFLMGKSKPYFVRNLDCGDNVVVVNAKFVKVTGKKETDKKYYRHSGYPGGFKVRTFKELMETKPEEIIRHAVRGMLPQTRLRDRMLTRLFVFEDDNHPYADKIKG
ncbi:MAG: 50S ribosomal protein L13 [Patescibacteria group bacterium]